jgi:8-oxo-dGTP pyrophosphatase MutT (NUDIX family)
MPLIHQSGAIVFRLDGKKPRVLLVTAKRNRENWIFPKGHVEKGETAEDAALREAKEEAGVLGKLIGRAGELEYKFLGARARVEYFVAEFTREAGPPEDGRARMWCGVDEAMERLNYKNTRRMLRKAWRQLGREEERRKGRERREGKGKWEGQEKRKGRERRGRE